MSRTMTMLSCVSSNRASPITARASRAYPRVSHASALATRSGVLRSPSRSGSSPTSSSCRRTSPSNSALWSGAGSVGEDSSARLPTLVGAVPRMRLGASVRTAAPPLLPFIFDIVVLRFVKPQSGEPARPDVRLEHAPARDDDVLRRGVDPAEEVDVHVHVSVVQLVDDFVLHDAPERAEVDHVTGAPVHLTGHGHLEHVVVTMPAGVVVRAVERAVLLLGERRVVQAMRGVEAKPARDSDLGHQRPPPLGADRASFPVKPASIATSASRLTAFRPTVATASVVSPVRKVTVASRRSRLPETSTLSHRSAWPT